MVERRLINYVNNGELCLIAGVKDVGKTSFLLTLAEELQMINVRNRVFYYYYSINDDISDISDLDTETFVTTNISELPYQTRHMIIGTVGLVRMPDLCTMLIDDYRSFLRTEEFRNNNMAKSEKILYLLTRFKTLAEVADIPVIITCDVDDDYIWGRDEKRPMLSDIPDHEYVEQIVDRVILLHRDEVFDYETEHQGSAEMKICDLGCGMNCEVMLGFLSNERRFYVPM